MPAKLNIIGEQYSRLMVLEEVESYISAKGIKTRRYKCQCECGNETIVSQPHLRKGDTQSCGCWKRERTSIVRKTHGHSINKSKEYIAWVSMKTRCYNPKTEMYYAYGGRGIKVCHRWVNDFQAFLQDMGRAPSPQHSIDRIDSKGDYEPSNCRWATDEVQGRNKSTTKLTSELVRYIRQQAGTKSQQSIADELGVGRSTVSDVINNRTWKDVI